MQSTGEAQFSSNFAFVFTVQPDAVWNGNIWLLEESAVLKINFSDCADVIGGDVLVHD